MQGKKSAEACQNGGVCVEWTYQHYARPPHSARPTGEDSETPRVGSRNRTWSSGLPELQRRDHEAKTGTAVCKEPGNRQDRRTIHLQPPRSSLGNRCRHRVRRSGALGRAYRGEGDALPHLCARSGSAGAHDRFPRRRDVCPFDRRKRDPDQETARDALRVYSHRLVEREFHTQPGFPVLLRAGYSTLLEVPPRQAKLSQFCHGCGRHVRKPLSERWHHCPCGVGPVQRDLYSAFLASTLSADQLIPSCAQAVIPWESAEARLQAAHARVLQRANEGQALPRSMGVPHLRPMMAYFPCHLGGGTAEARRLKQCLTSTRKSQGDWSMTCKRLVTVEYYDPDASQLGRIRLRLIA
jgi:hypothetical protein